MKRAIAIGVVAGVAGLAVYRYQTQRASFAPNSVPLNSLINPTDPFTYVAIALAATTAYVLKL